METKLKINNKGFISTASIYTLLVVFLSMLLMLYYMYANTRYLLTAYKDDLENELAEKSYDLDYSFVLRYCKYEELEGEEKSCNYTKDFNPTNTSNPVFDYYCTNSEYGVDTYIEYIDSDFYIQTNGETECTIRYY